jgi:hypothetical protein
MFDEASRALTEVNHGSIPVETAEPSTANPDAVQSNESGDQLFYRMDCTSGEDGIA